MAGVTTLTSALLITLLLLWAVGAYNRLVRLRAAALQAFGGMDAFVQQYLAQLEDPHALPPAPLAASHDYQALQAATVQLHASLQVLRARPLERDAASAVAAGLQALDAAWAAWSARIAQLDDAQWQNLEHEVRPWLQRCMQQQALASMSRQQFNQAVAQYNQSITQFPASVLAWLFGMKRGQAL